MIFVQNCLRANGGFIVPIRSPKPLSLKDVKNDDIHLRIRDYGLDVVIGEVVVPVPEFMLDYFADNRVVTIYEANDDDYLWEAVFAVEIPKEQIIEARGAYRFMQTRAETSETV